MRTGIPACADYNIKHALAQEAIPAPEVAPATAPEAALGTVNERVNHAEAELEPAHIETAAPSEKPPPLVRESLVSILPEALSASHPDQEKTSVCCHMDE